MKNEVRQFESEDEDESGDKKENVNENKSTTHQQLFANAKQRKNSALKSQSQGGRGRGGLLKFDEEKDG